MAGNVRFDPSSGSPDESGFSGNYPTGQRGNYTGVHLDRPASFRESNDGRNRSSGTSTSKGSTPARGDSRSPLSQSLMLEPITLGDQRYRRSGELKRALSISLGNNVSEDSSLGAAQPQPAIAYAELRRFRANVRETNTKARNRTKTLDDSLNKLTKFCDVLNSKKPQTHERSGGANLLKMGNQIHRNPQDQTAHKPNVRSKNAVLSKRARTPVADMRAEGRGNGIPQQHQGLVKEKDITKEGSPSSELAEEKFRRLPAGGETWASRIKRKRSASNVFPRPIDGDGELKRAINGRLSIDSGIQISDGHNFRSGSSNGSNVANKVEGTPSPASSSGRLTPKNEMEKASPCRELAGMNKERMVQKGANKLNMREGNHMGNPCSITKVKASRGPRTTATMAGNSSPSFQRMSAVLEDREKPLNVTNGISSGGEINRKRPVPTGSSSPPMAQWGAQRQKISRTRRRNIDPPSSNYDEARVSSQGCQDSELSSRNSSGANGSLPVRNSTSSTLHLRTNIENVPSPAGLSESENSVAAEHKLKLRAVGGSEAGERVGSGYQNLGSSGLLKKKNKLVAKGEIDDNVRRQGRCGRVSSLSRGSMSPIGEKLNNSAGTKPLRSKKPGSDKSGSKPGRPPLKKQPDRSHLTRLGPVMNCNSPDLTGESDDDREELMEAARFACSARYHASSSFWKIMEPHFSIRQEDELYLTQQLKSLEAPQEHLSGYGDKAMDHFQEASQPQNDGSQGGKQLLSNGFIESDTLGGLINEFQDDISPCGKRYYEEFEGVDNRTPLYHRVLSALIVEDEYEEYEENGCGRDPLLLRNEESSMLADGVYCNGKTSYSWCSRNQVPDEVLENNYTDMHAEAGATTVSRQNESSESFSHMNASDDSECQYAKMSINDKLLLELQSVGLCPETVPDLDEGGDELINQDIVELEKQLYWKIGKKKSHLQKIQKAVEDQKKAERCDLEQVAMDRLSELAYKKHLATQGSSGRSGSSKIPKDTALAFIRRILSRCRKFEDTGKSCFSEPPLRNVILAGPPSSGITEAVNVISPHITDRQSEAKAAGSYGVIAEQHSIHSDKSDMGLFDSYDGLTHPPDNAFAKNGPIANRGKKKEVLLDDVGVSASLRPPSTFGNTIVGGVKGKRSERERAKDLTRNTGAPAARPSVTNLRGERKAKSKPKQKAAAQSSVHPVGTSSGELVANSSSWKGEGLTSPGNVPDSSKDEGEDFLDFSNFPMPDMDTIGELNMEFDGQQDLGSLLNFDEANLQDHDSMGLETPEDDLSELNMFFQ